MSKLKIKGGSKLKGEVKVQGAKNEALQIISATLLTTRECIIHNVPNIVDVNNLLNILKLAGAQIERNGNVSQNTVSIKCKNIESQFFLSEDWKREAGKLRGSITLMGPVLSRFGAVAIPTFGGDKIGKRPIDTHINGFIALGYHYNGDFVYSDARKHEFNHDHTKTEDKNQRDSLIVTYRNCDYDTSDNGDAMGGNVNNSNSDGTKKIKCILLEEASVTGTANMILAAYNFKEKIVLSNMAAEPYIEQLCIFLEKLEMNIIGRGTSKIKLNYEGNNSLSINRNVALGKKFDYNNSNNVVTHYVLPDFIEVASFLSLASITDSDMWIRGCGVENLGMTLLPFRRLGINFDIINDDIHVYDNREYTVSTYSNGEPLTIYSEPWPKVSPDILSLLLVAAIQSHGTVLIHEKMYESRLFFTDKLIGMGAQIILCDPHRAIVVGLNRNKILQARRMDGPDIRAGMALVIAALSADGESIIDNAEQIDRGYENLVERLVALGAQVERVV